MQAGKLIVKLAINPVELRGKQWYKAGMITSLDQVSDFPLCWPDNKPRAAHRIDSRFKATLAVAHRLIEDEMRRWSAKGFVVSMAPAFRRAAGAPVVAIGVSWCATHLTKIYSRVRIAGVDRLADPAYDARHRKAS